MTHAKTVVLASAFAALGACGTEPDDRPATFEVVTLEVLAPSCGQVQCHSTATYTESYAFDTLDAARDSLLGLNGSKQLVVPAMSSESKIVRVIRGEEGERMPPDFPLPQQDLDLLVKWIDGGAKGLQ